MAEDLEACEQQASCRRGWALPCWKPLLLAASVLAVLHLAGRQAGVGLLSAGPPCSAEADWPQRERLWEGGNFTFMGAAVWYKKILFIPVKVYEAALFVEEAPAVAALGRLNAQGFFGGDYSEGRLAAALDAGPFRKLLQIRLLRSVTAAQFAAELGKELRPRLAAAGAEQYADPFFAYFQDRAFSYLSSFLGLWEVEGVLTGDLFPPGFDDFRHARLGQSLPSAAFCHALFDIYLGQDSIVPEGRRAWAQATLRLLQRQQGRQQGEEEV